MKYLNSLLIEGNVAGDAETKEPIKDFKVCDFAIGVTRYCKSDFEEPIRETSFFNVKAYGVLSEHCQNMCKKGKKVRIIGRLKQDRWKDENGNSRSRVFIIAEHIEFFSQKDATSEDEKNKKDTNKKDGKTDDHKETDVNQTIDASFDSDEEDERVPQIDEINVF